MAEDTSKDIQDQVLKAVEKGQDMIIDAVRRWAETGAKVVPDLPNLPLGDLLPKPDEVVASQFDFAEKLVANQRRFAEELLGAMRPKS